MATLKARFLEPMLLLRTDRLPEGTDWLYEVKLDGYRAIAFKTDRKIHLRSRNDNDFALRYPSIAAALHALPNETVVDGEIVALDTEGKPSFNTLQNYGSSKGPLLYYLFDVTSAINRELRRLGDVAVESNVKDAYYVLDVVGLPLRAKSDMNTGFALAVGSHTQIPIDAISDYVLRNWNAAASWDEMARARANYIDNKPDWPVLKASRGNELLAPAIMASLLRAQLTSRHTGADVSLQGPTLYTGSDEDLESTCRDIVAGFDAELLIPERQMRALQPLPSPLKGAVAQGQDQQK